MRDALGGSEKKREEGSLREDGEGVRSTGNLPPVTPSSNSSQVRI